MTSKPWSELTPREKDARVAAALGWVDFWSGSDAVCEYLMAYPPNEQAMGIEAERVPVPPFTTDRAACQTVLDEIARRGLIEDYQNALIAVLDLDMQVYRHEIEVEGHHPPDVPGNRFDADGHAYLWVFSQASPDQVCEAAVKVLAKGNDVPDQP